MPNFVSFVVPIAELARGEKSCTQSRSHSPSLFDVPVTEAFSSATFYESEILLTQTMTIKNRFLLIFPK